MCYLTMTDSPQWIELGSRCITAGESGLRSGSEGRPILRSDDHEVMHRRLRGRAVASLLDLTEENEPATSSARRSAPGDISALAKELVKSLDQQGSESDQEFGDGPVLLDVDIGDIRILALRREIPSPISLLSPREQEIARMVASGYPNKTIASVLEISSWTVASHLRRIFMKLRVSSRAAMVTRLSGLTLSEPPAPPIRPATGQDWK
jgi:DNA-binding CsgD family transcriptional regulator